MSPVWAVLRREYVERVRSKWFLLSTVGAPLFLGALVTIPIVMASSEEAAARRLVVVDRTGLLYDGVAEGLRDGGLEVERWAGAEDLDSLAERVAEGVVGAYLVLDQATLDRGEAHLTSHDVPSAVRRLTIRGVVVQAVIEERLSSEAAGVQALLAGGSLEVAVLRPGGRDTQEADFIVIYMGALLLYMVILVYAVAVMRSTLEEKTSRIVEIVISSIRPWQLMLGKVLGVGAVGLTQMAVWGSMIVLGAVVGLPLLIASRPEWAQLVEVQDAMPGLASLGLFFVFFLGGYFIYAAIYAAVGAMVSSEQEAQQAQLPVVLLLVAPLLLVTKVIENPASGLATTLSLVPFFTPVLMYARTMADAAPWWQVGLSVVLMAVTVVLVAWVAGRIYKVGILMAGKRPTLPELIRWVREA